MSQKPDIREDHATFSKRKQLIIYILRMNYDQQKIARAIFRNGIFLSSWLTLKLCIYVLSTRSKKKQKYENI